MAATITAISWLIVAFSKQTITADTDRVSGDFNCKHFLLLNVVVDSAAIYVDDFSGARNPDYLYVLSTALTPNLFPKHKRRLYFSHVGSLLFSQGKRAEIGEAPAQCVLKSPRFLAIRTSLVGNQIALWIREKYSRRYMHEAGLHHE